MSGPGTVSHALACIAFAVLAALVFASDRRAPHGRALALAAFVSAAWAGALTILEAGRAVPGWLVLVVEVGRYASLLYFLRLLLPAGLPGAARLALLLLPVLWVAAGLVVPNLDLVLIRGGLAASLAGLITLEQIYRNAQPKARAHLNLLMLGVGGMFAFDLFLFSQAELFHGFDATSWHARGIINALLVPFVAVGARRLPTVRFELFVSRNATFYTTAFLAVGAYILLTAAVGYLISETGAEWGQLVRLAFFVGAIAVLAALLASGAIRRQIRVIIAKHFYRSKYDHRLEWIRFVKTLSEAPATAVPAAAIQSVAQILGSVGGILYRRPEGADAFLPVASWSATLAGVQDPVPIPQDCPLVTFMRDRHWIVDLTERTQRPDLYDNVLVGDWLSSDPRWRLVSPIFLGDVMLGFFVLLEPPPPFRLEYEDRDLLHTAGQHVATLLAQQDADQRIAELSQFEAFNRLTAFVMHDLKNCAAQLSLLVANAVRHKRNPEFVDDAITTIQKTSERMTRLIEQLRSQATHAPSPRAVKLEEALGAALGRCSARPPKPVVEAGGGAACMVAADPERLTTALEHVIRNAQEAAGETGEVQVLVQQQAATVRISIRDTGPGMDPEFVRLRLFRPFDTTKGPSGMGIGAYQAREFARSIGGDVQVHSEPGRGTWFSFEFPLVPQ